LADLLLGFSVHFCFLGLYRDGVFGSSPFYEVDALLFLGGLGRDARERLIFLGGVYGKGVFLAGFLDLVASCFTIGATA
jgi:hypothetical protein